jgi:hypothetical protein
MLDDKASKGAKRPVMTMDGCVGIPARNKGWREQDFTGQVPERWWMQGASSGVWSFRDAATLYSQDEIQRLIEIGSRGRPSGNYVHPQPGDIYAPGLAEVWWEPNDIHTPILLQRLLRGELRAFGDPGKAGAWPEWIAPRAWRDLKRDPENEERFEGGGNVYWHVHVLPKELATGESNSSDPSARTVTNRPPYAKQGTTRWTACEAYTWVAFREARTYGDDYEFPKSEWSLDWKDRPRTSLSSAFICIETGQDWGPDEWGGRGKEQYLAWARALMRDTRLDARRLNELLTAHNERHGRNVEKLREAFRDVMTAVREARLTVWARPAFGPAKPNISAVHQALDPLLFEGSRAVSVTGWVDYAGFDSNEFDRPPENDFGFMDYEGPWFDEVRFDADQVRRLWLPSAPSVSVGTIRASNAGEKRLQAWLEAEMRSSPSVTPGKDVMRVRAKEAEHVFSGEGFNRAWANAVTATGAVEWSKAGRKSKRA